MADATLTWLGHAAFRIDTPGGKRVYVDPFLTGNPSAPRASRRPERVDVIALTHGHGDHVGDTVQLAKKFGAEIVAQVELKAWLGKQGAPVGELPGINKGGSQEIEASASRSSNAFHSSRPRRATTSARPRGIVIRLENGFTIYFAGDTCVFGDMQLIGRLYEPDVAVLPIGDWFTMGPKEAAVALELLGTKRCVPCHYGTFGLLTGTPAALRASSRRTSRCTSRNPAARSSFDLLDRSVRPRCPAVGRRDAVEVSRRRLGRAVGRGGRRGGRDAGVREPALRPDGLALLRAGAGAQDVVDRLTAADEGRASGSSASSTPEAARRPSPGAAASTGPAARPATAGRRRGTSSSPATPSTRSAPRSRRARAARSPCGYSKRSPPRRPRAATAAASSPRRCSSSRRAAVTAG